MWLPPLSLEHGIDLQAVVKAFPIVEYRPDVFPGLVFRTKRPRTANLVFRTGKMVCTGAKKEEEVNQAVMKLCQELDENDVIIYDAP
ncbi:MAG: hypothetical protein OEZ18_05705 [Candidatus Bathyarchaeota archaeon]|nr:hypothetical protein [Candidatus Bathyarchaeota archaeon]MDH5794036.1 hypothetical protein [Candidatus Bathyarchaeota archaeon]